MLRLCICVSFLPLSNVLFLRLSFAQDLVEAINQVRFERFDRVLHQVSCVLFEHMSEHRPHELLGLTNENIPAVDGGAKQRRMFRV